MFPGRRSRRSQGSRLMQATDPTTLPAVPPVGSEHSLATPTKGESKLSAVKDTNTDYKFTLLKSSPTCDKYIKMMEEQDKDILDDWEGVVDVTLVFAGLFSAISTSFVLESSKGLQPDPAVATVQAIQEFTRVVQAGFQLPQNSSPTSTASLETSFKPSMTSVWVNCLWFFSLGLSISVSLFAMLAKRWCYKSRSKHLGTSYERGLRRQEEWDTLQKWKLELLIDQLPTVMHVALVTFFIGLVLYLSEIHSTAMIITAVPIGITILLYGALTALPVWSPTCPMVTPFTRIVQAGCWYYTNRLRPQDGFRSYLLKLRYTLHVGEWPRLLRATGPAIMQFKLPMFHFFRSRNQKHTLSTGSPLVSEHWVLSGCSKPVGKTMPYLPTGEKRYDFRALIWALQNSDENTFVDGVLEHVNNYPEMVIASSESSQALYQAALAVFGHLQRFSHDAVESYNINTTELRAKCFLWTRRKHNRKSYLTFGPRNQDSYDDRLMGPEEVQTLIDHIRKQTFDATTCLPWLEQLVAKFAIGYSPEGNFSLCREVQRWVSTEVTDLHEEIYSALSWSLLNLVINTATTEYGAFWPTRTWDRHIYALDEDERDPPPVARCDSALTLSYFRHLEQRREYSQWLSVVGLSGVLNIPTYYPSEHIEPDDPLNCGFYTGLIELLRDALAPASLPPSASRVDPYIGKLPVYWGTDIRLYEFDSLHYCFDALERAIQYYRFAQFNKELEELKDMIPHTRRGPGPEDAAGTTVQAPPDVHGADTIV